MSPLRWLWLLLAIWGAIHPWFWMGSWFAEHGFDPFGMIGVWIGNPATRGLTWDVVISATALICFILSETLVRKNWEALLAIPATLLIGPSCGLPLYLFLRAAPIR